MRTFLGALLASVAAVMAGCAQLPPKDHLPEFHARRPGSILVIPVVNQSVDVEAPLAVLSTLPRLLAEKGYYVFPVNTVKTLLELEGLYEAAEVHATPAPELAELFGADSILYVTVHEWTTQYVFVHAQTIVDLEYKIVSSDGEHLWSARKRLTHSPQTKSTSGSRTTDLIVAAIGAALERLDPEFIPLVREANKQVFQQGRTALPPGPYARNYDGYYLALDPPQAVPDEQ